MSVDRGLTDFVAALPKAELHLHLEGSIRPETLLRLARRRGVALPADDVEGLREWFHFRDFAHFVEIYVTCCRCLRDPEDFQLVLDELLAEQERQRVLWSEIHFTISIHQNNGANGGEVAHALWETMEAAERRRGLGARIIPDIVRNLGPEAADRTLRWAVDHRSRGVVALGLSGFESAPTEPYAEHFAAAAGEGLRRVAHAGEHAGPESIRSALQLTGAERIGHGIRAIDDPDLVAELAERKIPLEVCPTSNVRLGAVPDLEEHPFDRLLAAGVEVTVNSDDPPYFETTLNEEYVGLARTFGYDRRQLAGLARAGFRHAFLNDGEREDLEGRFDRGLAELEFEPA